MEPLLQISHLTKNFSDGKEDEYKAVDDVSFELFPGEKLAIIGESGSGKSTLCKCVLGLLKECEGIVTHYTERPQMVFQDPALSFNPKMIIRDIVCEPLM